MLWLALLTVALWLASSQFVSRGLRVQSTFVFGDPHSTLAMMIAGAFLCVFVIMLT